jgi:ABC-type branched-subunit amino acid transport system ATPase component/ABC-type branched-subunit amino acid transport system permease subunit
VSVVIQFLLLGAATGALVALVALGVVITYRVSGVLILSMGAIGAFGAFVCYQLRDSYAVPWQLALAAGLASGGVLGAVTQVAVIRSLRHASNLTKLIASLAVLLVVQVSIDLLWPSGGEQGFGYPRSILPTDTLHLTDRIAVGEDRVILTIAALVIAVVLGAVLKKTLFGLATTAVAEDREVAAIGGWSPSAIELTIFVIAGILAAGAAIFIAPIAGLGSLSLTLLIVPAVAAALVGSFRSPVATVGAALAFGVLQAELSRFQPTIAGWLGFSQQSLTALPSTVPMLMIIVFTVCSGRLRSARGDLVLAQPLPGDGRIRLGVVVPAIAVAMLCLALLPPGWADSITLSVITAILVLSVVVVTGLAGQLSLAQFALAGFGAWIAARCSSDLGAPFEISLLLAIVATVPVGLLVALPSLRTRGVTLAIATLGFALMLQGLVFNNGAITGSLAGIDVSPPSLLGLRLDPVSDPTRYGVFVVACFVLCAVLVANLRRGRTGRRLLAVRSNERAAASLGVNVPAAKLYAFGVGAAIAALSGVLLAFRRENVQLRGFSVLGSFEAVQYAVIGGVAWVSGSLIGGLFAAGGVLQRAGRQFLAIPTEWVVLAAGVIILVQLRRRPDGIAARLSGVARRIVFQEAAAAPGSLASTSVRVARTVEPATLEVRGLTVRFGGVAALTDVSLRVCPGEVLGLIGPNGAGKTTLLDAVTGFTRAAGGSVTLDGRSIDRWSPERRARAGIGRSWQGVELFDELTVHDNLLVAADRHEAWRSATDLVRPGVQPWSPAMRQVVADFGLQGWLDVRPPALSYGVQQLVGIARAICAEPSVLLLDEPAAGLDHDERREVAEVIRRIAHDRGIGILLVEHDVPLVMSVSDRIVVLDFGTQIAEGRPDDVARDQRVIAAYLGGDREAEGPVGATAR